MSRFLLGLLLMFCAVAGLVAQSATPAAKSTAPANDVFSGTVTVSTAEAVTVVRTVPAKPDESRVFVVDKDTKIEGKVKVSSRVTVRFKADDDGAVHALLIIVRTDAKAPAGGATKQAAPPVRR